MRDAATRSADEVLAALGSDRGGLTSSEAQTRLASVGPNALRTPILPPIFSTSSVSNAMDSTVNGGAALPKE